jgi:hypothetical protein
MKTSRPAIFVVGLFSAFVLSAGLSVATASSSSSTIKACANKKTGALRLASKCKSSERSVSWSVTGPQGVAGATGDAGVPGPKGDTGAAGPAGERGPSSVYTTTIESVPVQAETQAEPLGQLNTETTVASVTLPAGKWLVRFDGLVVNSINQSVAAFCQLVGPDDVELTTAKPFFAPYVGAHTDASIYISSTGYSTARTFDLPAETPISLRCSPEVGEFTLWGSVTATQTAQIVDLTPELSPASSPTALSLLPTQR